MAVAVMSVGRRLALTSFLEAGQLRRRKKKFYSLIWSENAEEFHFLNISAKAIFRALYHPAPENTASS